MVLSRDWTEVCVLECILGGLHVKVDVETEPARVRAKLANSKIDALIVDCDLDGTAEFLRGLRRDLNTVPLLIIGKPNHLQHRAPNEAFILEKPISVERAVHTLSAARSSILDGRLRYHRHQLNVPVLINYGSKRSMAELLNLSQSGVAVRTASAMRLPTRVGIDFTLPPDLRIKVKGELVWKKWENAGFRFLGMTTRTRRDLQLWLAQRYLTQPS